MATSTVAEGGFSISKFREQLGAGSRPNLFLVKLTPNENFPFAGFEYVCRSASLPSSTVGLVEIALNGGRRLKMGGDRQFTEWTTTVLNDENFSIRKQLEAWQSTLVNTNYNRTSVGSRTVGDGTYVTGVAEIYQLDADGNSIGGAGEYKLLNCWPSDISTIDLSYDSTDTVEEFTVTWSYDYYIIGGNEKL
ncbi:hypothetical protein EBU95_19375 [bacterium]|nr:hypothetical protein [bacterium]